MKQILYILAATLAIYSCTPKKPDMTLPVPYFNTQNAMDSFHFKYNTFYRVVLNRSGYLDSSAAITFLSLSSDILSVKEYKTTTDTNGLHVMDSVAYSFGTSYSEYQQSDPNYYASSIGYVYTRYNPTGSGTNSFPLHDYMVLDTFTIRTGTPAMYNAPSGVLKSPLTDTTVKVTIYR